ncbi:glycosyltransferase family 1 protein, partial [Streptomyces parvulus]
MPGGVRPQRLARQRTAHLEPPIPRRSEDGHPPALRRLPDGAVVLLDGLVACGVPEIVVPEAERL